MPTAGVLRVANCSGFLGDRASAALEMVEDADIDVLTGDWLAELTMTILQKQRQRDPLKGYASTFLRQVEAVLGACLDRGIKIVSNAGGINPGGCAAAVQEVANRMGLAATIAHVEGDDILDRIEHLSASNELLDLRTLDPLQLKDAQPLVANAYLGGWAIAAALHRGADVVVTGRVTDASVVVGPAAWAFNWSRNSWNQLAGAVVAGHIIECGTQATGGNFAFFQEVSGFERLGFPIAEIYEDGSSIITKAHGTGGAVTRDTVTAQLLYEVQSTRYANPDVTTLLDSVVLADDGPDRVQVLGAEGEPPTDLLKVSLAVTGGFRNAMTMVLAGGDVEAKADIAQRALWDRIPGGKGAFSEVQVELIGRPTVDPGSFGEACALLRIAVAADDETLVGRAFSSAIIETGLASYPGFFTTTPPSGAAAFATYRPALVPAHRVPAKLVIEGVEELIENTGSQVSRDWPRQELGTPHVAHRSVGAPTQAVQLGQLLGARSGDKGGDANVGVWAREDDIYQWMDETLSTDLLRVLLPEAADLDIDRYRLPRLRAVNFVIHGFLGDGVSSCLRFDAQAKGLAEYLRSRYVDVPAFLLAGRACGDSSAAARRDAIAGIAGGQTVTSLGDAVPLAHGTDWRNRFAMAPLTNLQSHADGTLSEDEHEWLVARGRGGFGMTMTCASYVTPAGHSWRGQLGIASDEHLAGLTRLASSLHSTGTRSAVQLHHGGRRADPSVTGRANQCPWDDPAKDAIALTTREIQQVVDDFIAAAVRAEKAGFDGAEVHGAHGYLIAQFLDARRNHRVDGYGGSLDHRLRVVFEVLEGIRAATGPHFQLGLRLTPEGYGITLQEGRETAERVLASGLVDYLDMSLWDVYMRPRGEGSDRLLIDHFVDLPRYGSRLGVAGGVLSTRDAQWCLDRGSGRSQRGNRSNLASRLRGPCPC